MSDNEFFELCQHHPEPRIARAADHAILLTFPAGSRPGPPAPEIIRGFDNGLSGERVLPGFRLELRELRQPARRRNRARAVRPGQSAVD